MQSHMAAETIARGTVFDTTEEDWAPEDDTSTPASVPVDTGDFPTILDVQQVDLHSYQLQLHRPVVDVSASW